MFASACINKYIKKLNHNNEETLFTVLGVSSLLWFSFFINKYIKKLNHNNEETPRTVKSGNGQSCRTFSDKSETKLYTNI